MKTKAPISELKKRYDFSELEDRNYGYSVKIDKEKVVKQLDIEDGEVEVVEIRRTLEPYFAQEEGMLKMSFLNFQEEDVKMYVYDTNGELLTETSLGNDFSITKAIDISELRKGNYEIVLAHNDDYYEHKFSVN